MKYLLLVCWDAERMNGQTEPDPSATSDEEEEAAGWMTSRLGASGSPATSWLRRAEPSRSASAVGKGS